MTKIVFTLAPPGHELQTLRSEFPEVAFAVATAPAAQLRELADADAAVWWPTTEALRRVRRLRWIHSLSTGIDQLAALPELISLEHVTLTNARGAHAAAMADHCLALLLAFTRAIPRAVADTAGARWDRTGHAGVVRELSGSTLGVLGFGRAGAEITRRVSSFGVRVLAVDADPVAASAGLLDQSRPAALWGPDRLDDLLRCCDYLAVTAPLTARTRRLIGERELSLMPRGALLFVLSRGGIVDEAALVRSLEQGHLAGAGLDSTEAEPLPPEHLLWRAPNVLITPHVAGVSRQTRERGFAILRENLRRFLGNEPLMNVCDKRAGY